MSMMKSLINVMSVMMKKMNVMKNQKVNENYNKILKELHKRGMKFVLNVNPHGKSERFVLEWNIDKNDKGKYVCVEIRKNMISAFCAERYGNKYGDRYKNQYNKDSYIEYCWEWKFWMSKRIVNGVCDWIEREIGKGILRV